jgi:hypothetical protein
MKEYAEYVAREVEKLVQDQKCYLDGMEYLSLLY